MLGLAGDGLGVPGGEGRVVWRFDRGSGALMRQVWPTLSPASTRAAGPKVAVLTGLRGIDVSVFVDQQGWQDAVTAERLGFGLPRAVRVRLSHDRVAGLETVVVLR